MYKRQDPQRFKEFSVTQVPAIVVSEGNRFDKVTGAVSLEYALDLMEREGDMGA